MRAYTSGGVDDGDGEKRQEPACQAGGDILAAIEGVAERAVVGIVGGRRMMLAGLRHSLNRRRRPFMEVGLHRIGLQEQRQRGAYNQQQAAHRPPRHRRLMRFDCRTLHARIALQYRQTIRNSAISGNAGPMRQSSLNSR